MATVMSRTAEAIRDEMLGQLMPQGSAWPGEQNSNLASLLQVFAVCRATLEADIESLALEIAPGTAVRLLADYEAILGRGCCDPDPDTLSIARRQSIAQARWVGRHVVSRQDYISLAASLGFTIEIDEFTPARFGRATFGTPCYSDDWAFVWRVSCAEFPVFGAQFGLARFGDPYRTWSGGSLICEFNRRRPAHTTIIYEMSNIASPSGTGQFVLDANTLQ